MLDHCQGGCLLSSMFVCWLPRGLRSVVVRDFFSLIKCRHFGILSRVGHHPKVEVEDETQKSTVLHIGPLTIALSHHKTVFQQFWEAQTNESLPRWSHLVRKYWNESVKGQLQTKYLKGSTWRTCCSQHFFHCGKKKNGTHKRQSEAMLTTAQQESWSNTSPVFLCWWCYMWGFCQGLELLNQNTCPKIHYWRTNY